MNFREFWAIHAVSGSLTTTKTGPDGCFRLDELPREAGFRIFVEHPNYAWMDLYAATTNPPVSASEFPRQMIAGHQRPPVATGPLKITLHSTRHSPCGRSSPTRVGQPRRSACRWAVGQPGRRLRHLGRRRQDPPPPAARRVRGRGRPDGRRRRPLRSHPLIAPGQRPTRRAIAQVRVNPGCVLILEVVDARTGKGVPGVSFLCEPDGQSRSRVMVQSRTGYIDNPRSNADGRLRRLVSRGKGSTWWGTSPNPRAIASSIRRSGSPLPAGGTVIARFELQQ